MSHQTSRIINATPFFYGWVVLTVATAGMVMMGPSQSFTVSLFIDSWVTDLGISRSTISLLYGVATLMASFSLPYSGRLVDRFGPRAMMLIVTLAMGVACASVSLVAGGATLLLSFFAIRFFGFGSMQLASTNMIAQWFMRRRGFAMGIAGQSLALGLLLFPALGEALLSNLGWRYSWVAMGLLVWAITLPLAWTFYRDRPEAYGILPDGDANQAEADRRNPVSEENWTLAEARRTSAFWLFTAALTIMTMVMAGLIFHQVSLFEMRGIDRATAVRAFSSIALFTALGNLIMGQLMDRYSARRLLMLSMLFLAGAIYLIQTMSGPWQAMAYAALVGMSGGSFRVIDSTIWPKYFGRRHLGAIKGVTMMGTLGGTAFGPYPLGLSLDYLGSYTPALTALAAAALLVGVVTLFVQRPQRNPG